MSAINTLVGQLGVRLVKSFAGTSVETRKRFAKVVGVIFWYLVPKRRHVTLTNVKLCFPEKSESERLQLARRHYELAARAVLDHGVLWAGSKEDVQSLVKIEGLDKALNRENRPLILVTPHFIGLDAAIPAVNPFLRGFGFYQVQRNPAWNEAVLEGRKRFGNPVLLPKSHSGTNVRLMIQYLKQERLPFYYLPDMDYGRRESIFIPFFGVKAATIPAVSRLSRLTGAKVIFCVTEMTETGYTVHISDVWQDFPTKDAEADTIRIQKEIERWILKFPEQYLWTHRRFKTRPEGEPSLY